MVEVARVGPRLVRVSLGGSQLEGFTSLGFDHVKVFIPTEGTSFDPALPTPAMRDYTPHHLDRDALSLQLDFVHHTEGPATRLAMQAKAGDRLMIGGLAALLSSERAMIGTCLPAMKRLCPPSGAACWSFRSAPALSSSLKWMG